jgi:cell division protein FtsZ
MTKDLCIKIIGVGGAGNNAIQRLHLEGIENLPMVIVDTDTQALHASPIQEKRLLGRTITHGFSTGGETAIGKKVAETDREILEKLVHGVDLLFILSGIGGGTGSAISPILAEIAEKSGALIICFVTLPFTFEGERRYKQADSTLTELRNNAHAVIPLPNDMIMQQLGDNTSVTEAFSKANQWISRGVHSIWSVLSQPGLINVDFATLKKLFETRGGKTLYGLSEGEGENCVKEALKNLWLCPLLHTPEFSKKADNLIVHIEGDPDLTMSKVNEMMTVITKKFSSKKNTVFGAVINETMHQKLRLFVLGVTEVESRKQTSNTRQRQPQVHSHHCQQGEKNKKAPPPQKEFTFNQEEQRGYFKKTQSNFYNGEDLDIPTFLRRGIKINL